VVTAALKEHFVMTITLCGRSAIFVLPTNFEASDNS